jgi:hypothetical protein
LLDGEKPKYLVNFDTTLPDGKIKNKLKIVRDKDKTR